MCVSMWLETMTAGHNRISELSSKISVSNRPRTTDVSIRKTSLRFIHNLGLLFPFVSGLRSVCVCMCV